MNMPRRVARPVALGAVALCWGAEGFSIASGVDAGLASSAEENNKMWAPLKKGGAKKKGGQKKKSRL